MIKVIVQKRDFNLKMFAIQKK